MNEVDAAVPGTLTRRLGRQQVLVSLRSRNLAGIGTAPVHQRTCTVEHPIAQGGSEATERQQEYNPTLAGEDTSRSDHQERNTEDQEDQ